MIRFRPLFPNALIYKGRYYSGEFRTLIGESAPSDSIIQSLETCISIFRRAACIVTGRYHGLVMAKTFDIPCEIGTANLPKLVDEKASVLSKDLWCKHYDLLKDDVMSYFLLSLSSKLDPLIEKDPGIWEEDERNRIITDIVTQSPLPFPQLSVDFVQGMSNEQLWLRKRSISTKLADRNFVTLEEK